MDRALRQVRAAEGFTREATGAGLSRASVSGLQSADRRWPRLPVRAAARWTGQAARLRHQGFGADAMVADGRWATDAEGRRARDHGCGDAGGAGRLYVEGVLADRNR